MASASQPLEIEANGSAAVTLSGDQLLAWRRMMLATSTASGDASARAAAFDWLLDLAGGLRWRQLQELRLHPQRTVQLIRPLSALEALWQRHRLTDEPLQYLVGICPWRDLELAVAPGVLIPRQESELLIDLALELLPHPPAAIPLLWADLGTGSGCLALALLRALPASHGLAVDASAAALLQAGANLAALEALAAPAASEVHEPRDRDASRTAPPSTTFRVGGADTDSRLQLRQGHWWEAIEPWWGQLQLVVSNPPYIPSAEIAGLDPVVRDHEPRLALDGGPDGLEAIRSIIAGAGRGLAPGGVLLLEHHHDQSEAVQTLLHQAGLQNIHAHHDLEGIRRFASASRASGS